MKDMKDCCVESAFPFMSYDDIMHDDSKTILYRVRIWSNVLVVLLNFNETWC